MKITPCLSSLLIILIEGLVICASLIDKPSNLGGITRTAEIFGAEKLTFDNLKVLKDKNYTSLAVTAMKWLDIAEVKKGQVPDWLEQMRKKGYCVVGLEQTTNSVMIQQVGNRREQI